MVVVVAVEVPPVVADVAAVEALGAVVAVVVAVAVEPRDPARRRDIVAGLLLCP